MRWSGSVLAAAAAVVLAACGGGQDYDSPRALADALAEAGVVCEEFQEGPNPTGATATAECRTGDGRDIGLQVHDEAEGASRLVSGADILLAGTGRMALVHDGRWIVYVDDERTARTVQDALGGEIVKVATGR
jgi:hypothetical protein